MVTRRAVNNNSPYPKPVEDLGSRASRVCLFDSQRERTLCANGYTPKLWCSSTRKRANSNNKKIIRAERIGHRRDLLVHYLCDEGATSNRLPLLLYIFECNLFIFYVHP